MSTLGTSLQPAWATPSLWGPVEVLGAGGTPRAPLGDRGALLEPPRSPLSQLRGRVAAAASVWVGDGFFCKQSCSGGKQRRRADRWLFWEEEREFSGRGVQRLGAFPGPCNDGGEHGQHRQPECLAQQFVGSASFGMLLVVWTLWLGQGDPL